MARGQAERLMPMLEGMLDEAGAGWRDLDAIGVGTGPGNFTGIRISVSAARGLALGLGVPAFGVTLLEALAHGVERPVLACLDARRGMGYFQRHGFGDPAPFMAPVGDPGVIAVANLRCVGNLATGMADLLGATHPSTRYSPASAIARVAAERHREGGPVERPAPLYLRAPDATAPRESPPAILTRRPTSQWH